MRCGDERLFANVVCTLSSANTHHGDIFANVRATRIKMLIYDGLGVQSAARCLSVGLFVWLRGIDVVRPTALMQA
ncbi:MAG: hypothetical protein EOO38_02530 [Cytophagaceae bacterium]|nr:MAG: hypothetical protein EOO38_02530 [Cytophagaceae bacterium]